MPAGRNHLSRSAVRGPASLRHDPPERGRGPLGGEQAYGPLVDPDDRQQLLPPARRREAPNHSSVTSAGIVGPVIQLFIGHPRRGALFFEQGAYVGRSTGLSHVGQPAACPFVGRILPECYPKFPRYPVWLATRLSNPVIQKIKGTGRTRSIPLKFIGRGEVI